MRDKISFPNQSAIRPINAAHTNKETEYAGKWPNLAGTKQGEYGVKIESGDYKPPKGFKIDSVLTRKCYTLLWIVSE